MSEPFVITLIDHEWENLEIEKNIIKNFTTEETPIKFNFLQSRDKTEIMNGIKNTDAIIVMYANISKEIIDSADNLKIISRYGIGVNNIDVKAASQKGIIVGNVGDYCIEEVSNHALSMILSSTRRLFSFNYYVKNNQWDFKLTKTPVRASKLNVGLVGFGQIAKRLAEKLDVIGYNVLAYDPFVEEKEMNSLNVKKVSMNTLLNTSDYVSLHSPLTDDTHHLIQKSSLEKMKESAVLINTSRGALIRENDLIDALNKKTIAGASLDVIENEPLRENHPFLSMDNVVLSPHAAWYSEDAIIEIRSKAVMNVINYMQGKTPRYIVNKNSLGRLFNEKL